MCPETRGSPEAHKGRVTALLLGVNCVGPKNGVVGWWGGFLFHGGPLLLLSPVQKTTLRKSWKEMHLNKMAVVLGRGGGRGYISQAQP